MNYGYETGMTIDTGYGESIYITKATDKMIKFKMYDDCGENCFNEKQFIRKVKFDFERNIPFFLHPYLKKVKVYLIKIL